MLGAGGVTGSAYLAGALTALEQDMGWDARTADVIVGTSAGALVGAMLRSGVPASDLSAWTVGAAVSQDAHALIGALDRPEFDPFSFWQLLRPLRVPHPTAVWTTFRHPLRFDAVRAVATHLADGSRDINPHLEFLGHDWPAQDFFSCAVRRRDGRRTVFGQSLKPNAGLAPAVAASCAVPGYFAPVVVDDEAYIDGGVASMTNADTLRDRALDVVIVLAPMSAPRRATPRSMGAVVREVVRRKLNDELGPARRRGIPTFTFAPSDQVLDHIGNDFMDGEHTTEVVREAFFDAGRQLQHSRLAEILAPRRRRNPQIAAAAT